MGRAESAAVHWRRYLELDLGSPWAKIARAHLEEGAEPAAATRRPRVTTSSWWAAAGASTRWPGRSRRARASAAMVAAPGNPGIARHARCVAVKDTALDDLVDLARRERLDLVGGRARGAARAGARRPAARAPGFAVFGPSAAAARLESSKAFSKDLMARHGIPTARFRDLPGSRRRPRRYCRELGAPLVVKADGLAAGKGVIVCRTLEEADRALALCFEERAFGVSGLTRGGRGVPGRRGGVVLRARRRRRGAAARRRPGPQDGLRRATGAPTPAAWAPTRRRRS